MVKKHSQNHSLEAVDGFLSLGDHTQGALQTSRALSMDFDIS